MTAPDPPSQVVPLLSSIYEVLFDGRDLFLIDVISKPQVLSRECSKPRDPLLSGKTPYLHLNFQGTNPGRVGMDIPQAEFVGVCGAIDKFELYGRDNIGLVLAVIVKVVVDVRPWLVQKPQHVERGVAPSMAGSLGIHRFLGRLSNKVLDDGDVFGCPSIRAGGRLDLGKLCHPFPVFRQLLFEKYEYRVRFGDLDDVLGKVKIWEIVDDTTQSLGDGR